MNIVTLAVAGGRKTQSIVDKCEDSSSTPDRILTITYTRTGQRELKSRLAQRYRPRQPPRTIGWWSFLLRHWVQPYLPTLFPDTRLMGFNFQGEPARFAKDKPRYLDGDGRAYGQTLAKLAHEVNQAAGGAVLDRLEAIYSMILIDEVQDLVGWDLEIVRLLLGSAIDMVMVGDLRQSLLETDFRAAKNKKYRGLEMFDWFQALEDTGELTIEHSERTWRCCQEVADLADQVFAAHDFPPTKSQAGPPPGHSGAFAITPAQVDNYVRVHTPTCLRHSKATAKDVDLDFNNFGRVKGLTFDHVLIYPTGPIRSFLTADTALRDRSACGLYVAITRAKHSVAFVLPEDDLANTRLRRWP